jgi:hypothetical protein
MQRKNIITPLSNESKAICDIINAIDDELGEQALDYIHDIFIEGHFIYEKYDNCHTDVCDNPILFPVVFAILKRMNPSMQMIHEPRREWWGSNKGQTQYHAVYMWDSRVPWYIPQELFGIVNDIIPPCVQIKEENTEIDRIIEHQILLSEN